MGPMLVPWNLLSGQLVANNPNKNTTMDDTDNHEYDDGDD